MALVFDDIEEGLDRLEFNLTHGIRPALRRIGSDIVNSIQSNMRAGIDIDGVPFTPNTETTKRRKLTTTVLIETQDLMRAWTSQATDTEVEVFNNTIYAATMQFGARKGQFGTAANGAPIPWGDTPPRKMIPNERDRNPVSWEDIIFRHIDPLLAW